MRSIQRDGTISDNNNKSYTAYWSEYAEGIIRALELKKLAQKNITELALVVAVRIDFG